MNNMGCLFCKIRDGKVPANIIWENNRFIAFLDINPVNPGHVLLIPKKHIGYIFGLREPLYSEIFRIAKRLSAPIRKAMHAKRIGLAIEGFSVPHVHLHIVPLHQVNDLNPERAKKATRKQLSVVRDKIMREMRNT